MSQRYTEQEYRGLPMPEFSYGDWDAKKRKNRHSGVQSNSSDGDYVSSSASAPKSKKKRFQPECTSPGSEEVADSDDLQPLGRELFEQTPSSGLDKGIIGHTAKQREKDGVVESNAVANGDEERVKESEESKKAEDKAAREAPRSTTISLSATRSCMQALIEELREARKKMLQWMRQEMHNILCEGVRSPDMRVSFAEGSKGDLDMEEERSQPVSASAGIFGDGSAGMQPRGQCSGGGGGASFLGQNSMPGSRPKYGGRHSSAEDESNFGIQNSGSGTQDIVFGKQSNASNESMCMALAAQPGGHGDIDFGARKSPALSFGAQSREISGPGGGLQNNGRIGIVSGFERQNRGEEGVGFSIHDELRDLGFGGRSGVVGSAYGGQSTGPAAMMFSGQRVESGGQGRGRDLVDLRNSAGLGGSNASNTGVANHHGSSLRISNEERTPDLIGTHNQNGTAGGQSPVALNMVWNMMQQSGRTGSHGVPDSRGSSYNYEAHNKLVHGADIYRGMVGSGSRFENSTGMINSGVLHDSNATLGMQLPLSMQGASTSLNSSSMPMLIGMQGQVSMQNSSNMQNFLGLSMNGLGVGGAINRQVFPGMYLQEGAQHSFGSSKGPLMSTSGTLHATAHKRGTCMQGMDILELNT